MKKVMKTLLTHLIRFTAFNAVTLGTLFGLPALAERHPFILLVISLAVLIPVAIANFKAAKETDRALQAHRHTTGRTHHKAA